MRLACQRAISLLSLLLASLPLLATTTSTTRWSARMLLLALLPSLAWAETDEVTGTQIAEVHIIFPCGPRGAFAAPYAFPGSVDQRDEEDFPIAEAVNATFPHSTSFTCTHSRVSDTTAEYYNAIVDPIIERAHQSATSRPPAGRMAIVASSPLPPAGIEAIGRAAREGVAIFFFGHQSAELEAQVNSSQHFMLAFMTNQLDGAANVGSELCRRWGSATQRPLRVAAMYAPDPAFDGRISMAIRGFEADCPDSKVVMVASERLSNWHEHTAMMYMESTFLADETISAVLTATNHFAIGAVKAADKRLSAGAAQGLFVSSFGYKAELAPYLAEDRVFATADELLTRPNQGVWRTMASTMEQASHLGWMTTADVQAAIPSMMGVTLQSSSLLIPSDAEGHIISTMLSSAYNPEVRPLPAPLEDDAAAGLLALQPGDAREGGIGSLILAPTTVYVGIDQLVVQQIDVPANTFQATFWLDMSWYDARLTWTRGQYSGDIQVSKARVWTPDLYVLNHLSETVERDGGETLVTMRNDGTVFWSRKITGEFDCKMHIEPYPFDIHRCYINITTVARSTKLDLHGYGEARIPAPVGFTIIAQPEGFLPIERLCAASVCGIERVCGSDERVCGVSKGISVRSRPRFEQKQLSYTFRITREPSYVITSYVMMAWLLVILSMLQFWIPEESGNMDRAGLAITTVLATVVLMTEGVVSKVKTWLSYFFIVCTAYQAAAFLTTICAGRRFGHSAKQDAFAASQPALPVVRPPRATCSPSAWAERNWPGLSTWLASVFMACEELTGHPEDDMQDLFAIRFLVPSFLLVCILLPLLTLSVCSGADCPKEEHPDAGVHSDLFLANAIGLGLWCVAFAVSVYGRRARPRFDSLKRTREHVSNRVTLRRER